MSATDYVTRSSAREGSPQPNRIELIHSKEREQTAVDLDAIVNREIQADIRRQLFERRIESIIEIHGVEIGFQNVYRLIGDPTSWIASLSPRVEEGVATQAIDNVAKRLSLATQHVLKAAGVRSRTYYSWRNKPGREPRVGSLGRLWQMVQFVDQLELMVEPKTWITDPERLQSLRDGKFDQLLDLAADSVKPSRNPSNWSAVMDGEEDVLDNFTPSLERPQIRPSKRIVVRRET